MRKPLLLLLLLCGTVHLFAQNKLPGAPQFLPIVQWTTLAAKFTRYCKTFSEKPLDLKYRTSDSLYRQWRQYEMVKDEEHPGKYLIIITLDGFRWQEVFTGADSILWHNTLKKAKLPFDAEDFWEDTPEKRRVLLMPFLWTQVAEYGQIYGNRQKGSAVTVTNKMRISYPGYNEIFAGYPDDQHIKLNFKIPNPNANVLRFIGQQKPFRGRVASFASWDVFPSIMNAKKGEIYVNAAFEPVKNNHFSALNRQLQSVSKPWGKRIRPDSLTAAFALQYLRQESPRVLHIGLGETDEYAHEKKYAEYLSAAKANDQMIRQIWQFVQSSPRYRNKTTLFITTDHGRGNSPDTWHKHHTWVDGAEEIWFAVMGPETSPKGEIEQSAPYFQCQFAQTFAAFLGLEYQPAQAVTGKISALFETRDFPQKQRQTIDKSLENQLITKK